MRRVVIVAFDGVQSLDVTGPAEVFAGANQHLAANGNAQHGYDVSIVSPSGGPIATESAVRLHCEPMTSTPGPIDTLVIPGGFAVRELADDERFIEALGEFVRRSERLVTVCSGTFLAAATGALDGHRVTTHWARAERLAERCPDIEVDADPIFIHSTSDGALGHRDVWTSAGVTAGIDMSLAIVEHDHSTAVAQNVAQWLVMFLRRPGGQTQFASPTWIRHAPPGPVHEAQRMVIDDPAGDLRVVQLADRVGMSERHFVRKFSEEVGESPARFVARVRVDAARHELETSTDTVDAIARRCGLGTGETLRRTLIRHIGVSPAAYRQRFTHTAKPDPNPAPNLNTKVNS